MMTWLQNPIVKGAITGVLSAAAVDLHALTKFTDWSQLRKYQWSTASFRWFTGAVTGAIAAAGYGALIG